MRKLMTKVIKQINLPLVTVMLALALCLTTITHVYQKVFWIAFQ
jgi:hypothetical protein